MNLSYGGQTILDETNTTPFGGNVVVDADTEGGTRINPGGAAIYENYEVMFLLPTNSEVDGEVILVPNAVPETSVTALAAVGVAGLLLAGLRRVRQGWNFLFM